MAENLNRHEHEVFITIPTAARTVRLWIADAGALDQPIGTSPLVVDATATANYKTGRAPWGQDLRGDAALISVFQRHLLVTGLSNQGKTAALRALAVWGRGGGYAEAALAGEYNAVANASEGERNWRLTRAARALGRFVADGRLTRTRVEEALKAAGSACGLSERECRATITNALNWSVANNPGPLRPPA